MRVLFVHKNCESLGIGYISSVLKKDGHKTDLIYDPGAGDVEYSLNLINKFVNFEKGIFLKLKRFSPDLIAFSCMTNLYPWVSKLSRKIKEDYEIPIIIGGIHPTILLGDLYAPGKCTARADKSLV